MKTKHTPGPWLFTGISGVLYIVSKYNPYALIARVIFTPGLGKQCYKNSQLMAAAPDLLEACRCALADLEGFAQLLDIVDMDHPAILTIGELKAAIKKAGAE